MSLPGKKLHFRLFGYVVPSRLLQQKIKLADFPEKSIQVYTNPKHFQLFFSY